MSRNLFRQAQTMSTKQQRETFGAEGAYVPGSTEAFLTDMFMKLADMHSAFGDDRKAATDYIFLEMSKVITSDSCGVLLTDINNPQGTVFFMHASGDALQQLMQAQMPLNQGIFGHCVEQNAGVHIENLSADTRFTDDAFSQIEGGVGPFVCVPVQGEDRLHGFFIMLRRPGVVPFTTGEFNILSYVCQALGSYLTEIAESS